jgi:uncharacterized DUF497 family protein
MNKQYILSAAKRFKDLYSDLYYEIDMENGGFGNVVCETFEWDRAKSNLNVKEKGYSFYLARTIFFDEARTGYGEDEVVNGERRVKIVGRPFGLPGNDLLVVVKVALDREGIYRRIISSWENESLGVEEKYEQHRMWVIKSNAALKRDLDKMRVPASDSDPLWRFRIPRPHNKGKDNE